MIFPVAVPLLSLLVWLPAAGGLAVAAYRGRSPRACRALGLAATIPSLLLAVFAIARFDVSGPPYQLVELHSWVPALGISYDLGVDGLGAVLVVWVALVATLSLALSKCGRETPLLLALETSLLGLAASRDAVLFLCFQGAAIFTVFLLIERGLARSRWLGHQLAGLLFFVGFFLVCYRLALDQTGFPSADLSRLRSLVVFPAEERRLFVLAGLGAVVAAPLFPFVSWVAPTLDGLSSAGRALFLGGAILVPPFALVRLALPVTAGGAASWSSALALLGLASVAYAALAPRRRGLAPLVVGLQGLVLAGLVAPRAGEAPAELRLLALGAALAALALFGAGRSRREASPPLHRTGALVGLAVLVLAAWPLGWAWLAPVAGGSIWMGAVIGLLAVLAASRVVRSAAAVERDARALPALVVLVAWTALLAAPRAWTARIGPAAIEAAPGGAAEEKP